MPNPLRLTNIADDLLAWYDGHARTLPWRAPPGVLPADPYRVWLSEVMLQQTTVAAVAPRYARFLARWPTVADLAAAHDADVMQEWAGLGYYARARNLHACAKAVVADHGGAFPRTESALRALPGVGAYTAAAIAAIAFGARAVVVDGNVERVIARLACLPDPVAESKPRIRELADGLTPDARCGDYAQAMMDLGATICTPRNPQCLLCPIRPACAAHRAGQPEAYPVRRARVAKPRRYGAVYWLEQGGSVLLIRRPPNGLLGGLLAFPTSDWGPTPMQHPTAGVPCQADWALSESHVQHAFTHFHLELKVLAARLAYRPPFAAAVWWRLDDLASAGLPTVMRKAAALAGRMRPL